ncbi:MAG: hypothetical protein GXY44_16545 [Phycisphaerales bacterium]|nr:hypothetical protein [Phycisphaerales bacterium]
MLFDVKDYDNLPEGGPERVITISRHNLHRTLQAAVKRAEMTPWPDLFQALRRSCETEWALTYPQHAVSAWLGHSEAVSRRHYLQVPDSLFDAVSGAGKSVAECAANLPGTERNCAEIGQSAVEACTSPTNEKPQDNQCFQGVSDDGPGGIRTPGQAICSRHAGKVTSHL